MADSKTLCRVFAVALPPLVPVAQPLPRCEACHWIFGSLCSPTNPVPLPPRCAGAQQPMLCLEPLIGLLLRGALLSHRLRGEGGGASHQRGRFFRPQGRFACFPIGRKPGCKGFIHIGGGAAHHNPRAIGASNFRTLRLQACQTSARRAVSPHAFKGVPSPETGTLPFWTDGISLRPAWRLL